MAEYNFQKELEATIFQADDKLDRDELLIDVFKMYVAKLFEFNLAKQGKDRLESDLMIEVKKNLITEFRNASLEQFQKSEKWYEELFDETIKEILNDCALAHKGAESVSIDKHENLQINPEAYVNEGGLFVPEHMKKS